MKIAIGYYIVASLAFALGYMVCALLSIGREADRKAEQLRTELPDKLEEWEWKL